jgi:hypothetical protein
MLNQRREAAQEVADCLIAAENAIDIALSRAAELNSCMPMARSKANLAAEVGHDAIESAADAFATLVQARRKLVEAHRHLAATKDQIGLRTVGLGGLMPKPPSASASLTIVDRKAA